MKFTSAIRQVAYGAVPDGLDEYLQMGATTARKSLQMFCKAIMELYGEEFLRKTTYTDTKKLYAYHEEKHVFSGMLISIDCILVVGELSNCIQSSILMNNDVNILRQFPLFNDLKSGKAPDVPFVANNVPYKMGYYLTDGIYPQDIRDPEHPYSLEQLNVLSEDSITVDDKLARILITFTPTIQHCSMATVIGLCLRVKLKDCFPSHYKVDIKVAPGSHADEEAVNKQLNDKERVVAAMENPNLRQLVDEYYYNAALQFYGCPDEFGFTNGALELCYGGGRWGPVKLQLLGGIWTPIYESFKFDGKRSFSFDANKFTRSDTSRLTSEIGSSHSCRFTTYEKLSDSMQFDEYPSSSNPGRRMSRNKRAWKFVTKIFSLKKAGGYSATVPCSSRKPDPNHRWPVQGW
ncbi:AE7-like protein 1 [Tanacetum coccineum]|uniref:AE7-like protein 1 n=1 Tax=Tanacetum coccineum TaxID=301880 RepID=A0ABQ5DZP2_9ASTR